MTKEQNLSILINNIDDPIWLVDRDFTILGCNHAFKKWVTCFIGQELGEGDNVLFENKNALYTAKFEMCYRLAIDGRAFRTVEDMMVGNETRYTAVSFHPVTDEHSNIIGASCHARDITEQRKHLQKIEEQNIALREIAFIESHKLRGPVATIMGLEQLFNFDDFSDPVNKIVIEGVAKASNDLDLVIREVVHKSNEIGPLP